MSLKSFFKVSVVLKLMCLLIVLVLSMNRIYAVCPDVPFEEVAQTADIIFIGTAAEQESYFNQQQTLIFTEVLFDDITIVHCTGQAVQRDPSLFVLKYAGGCVGDLCLDVSDGPSFREGHRYLLFVSDDGKTYANPIIGGPQGFFRVVKDVQTGEEFLLTAGKKAILEGIDHGPEESKFPVSYIKNGAPVYDMSRRFNSESALAQPPIPASPSDKASISSPKSEHEGRISSALKLPAFIDYIKDVALRVPIEKKILKKGGMGFFFRKKGMTIEKIPFDQLITADDERELEQQDKDCFETEYTDPLPTDGSTSKGKEMLSHESFTDISKPLGGQLGACGYHDLYLVMEMVPEDWWSYNTIEGAMWVWNQFMDIYRKRNSDGRFGHNGENEFGGWPDDSTLFRIYGVHWNDNVGLAYSWYRRNPCGRLLESDVIFNPAYNWTDDEEAALGNNDLHLLRLVAMHELGHTWGMQRGDEKNWGYAETYDYDAPTVMHSYPSHIVENGRGIHVADAYWLRRQYSNQTGIMHTVDVGVESYYADNGLHNSTASSSTYKPGDSITLKNITVENIGYNNISDVRIRFYLSKNRNITDQDYQIGGYWSWDSFGGEQRSVFDISTSIPGNIPAGTYYIGAIVTVNGYNQDDYRYNDRTSFYSTIIIKSKSSSGNGSEDNGEGCFIATAVFNSKFHPYVTILRDFRDTYLMHNAPGRYMVDLYYKYSPFLAKVIAKHRLLKIAVRKSLLPVVVICNLMLQKKEQESVVNR